MTGRRERPREGDGGASITVVPSRAPSPSPPDQPSAADRPPAANMAVPKTGERVTSQRLLVLVEQAQNGDEEAMHQVLLAVMARIRNGVRYLVRGDGIDDLVQDVLVTVLRRLQTFQGRGRFEAWVDGVTMRVVLGGTRKLRLAERRNAPLEGVEPAFLPCPDRYATGRQLVRALDQLADPQRRAVVLRHVFGLTVSEIAQHLAAPEETVRSRLRVGMGHLRASLVAPPDNHNGAGE